MFLIKSSFFPELKKLSTKTFQFQTKNSCVDAVVELIDYIENGAIKNIDDFCFYILKITFATTNHSYYQQHYKSMFFFCSNKKSCKKSSHDSLAFGVHRGLLSEPILSS